MRGSKQFWCQHHVLCLWSCGDTQHILLSLIGNRLNLSWCHALSVQRSKTMEEVLDPLLCFAVSAARQLRKSAQAAGKISVFISTSRFDTENYSNSQTFISVTLSFLIQPSCKQPREHLRRFLSVDMITKNAA